MSDKYPLPAYACSIWVAGDSLMVAFPGTITEQGHTIKLPISEGGLKAALHILRERAQAQDLRIGQRGTPTNIDAQRLAALNEALNAESRAKREARAAERAEASEFLKELGL